MWGMMFMLCPLQTLRWTEIAKSTGLHTKFVPLEGMREQKIDACRLTLTLAARGLEELFFPVVLLCQYLVLVGNRFWFYILLMYLEYNTVVVLC